MSCSKPNLIGIGGQYENSTFLGPRNQEKTPHDLGNDNVNTFVHDIPCGKCNHCRIQRRYDRAARIMLEAECWPEKTYFITLTYEKIDNPDLDHSDWSQFIKDFRSNYCQAQHCPLKYRNTLRQGKTKSVTFKKIKQVMTGEYGDTFGRKHFHGIIFNHSFSDLLFTGDYSSKGHPIHTSPSLAKTWKKGRVQISPITHDLALYVGSYVTDALEDEDPNDGHLKKQYGLFGRGIGLTWVKKNWKDLLRAGKLRTLEREYPIPRYFQKYIELHHPAEYAAFKRRNLLQRLETRDKNIQKGDGPLRRAKAKGEILQHTINKRKKDENGKSKAQSLLLP